MEYNRKRHIELLKLKQEFDNQGKSFWEEKENPELLGYNAFMESSIYWTKRYQLLSLLEEFVKGRIDGEGFSEKFGAFRRNLLDKTKENKEALLKVDSDEFQNWDYDPRAEGFNSMISFLRLECDDFDEDYQNPEFYESIQNCLVNFQEALNQD